MLAVLIFLCLVAGRAIAGEDSIEELTSRADVYAQRMIWVRENRQRIVDCITAAMTSAAELQGTVVPTGGETMLAVPPAGFEWGATY